MEIIPFTFALEDARLRNTEQLSKGTGARYLECIRGQGEELVAKQWRRKIPKSYQVLVDFGPQVEFAVPRTSCSSQLQQ